MSPSVAILRDRKLDDVRISRRLARCALGAHPAFSILSIPHFLSPRGISNESVWPYVDVCLMEGESGRASERARGSFGAPFLGMLPPTESQVPMLSILLSSSLFEGPTASLSIQRASVCHLSPASGPRRRDDVFLLVEHA